jgi:hypothetical protein
MRRTSLLLVVAAIAATALPSSAAGKPVLDGKKAKSFAFSQAVSTPQQHIVAETAGDVPPVDAYVTNSCVAPRCYAFPFDLRPAKGVSATSPLSAQISWTLPTTRIWLQVMDVTKKTPVTKAECWSYYTTAGTSAVARLKSVKPGAKYAIWVVVQQVVAPDTVKGTVAFPGTHTPKASPGPSPSELFVNGCNS